jgi:Zn-dependent protease with chaperone function
MSTLDAAYGPERSQALAEAFSSNVARVPVSLAYRWRLVLVAIAMVILPLVYLALIAAVAWGVFLHATRNVGLLQSVESGKAALMAYGGPLFIGVVLLLFMVKPLFARRSRGAKPRSLRRAEEPVLFDFVERLCAAVGSPAPKRIDVDAQVNASAGFRRGTLSFLGNDLVLTIGMPLVAGLSLRQLAGVLAHEFGHFSQGAAMRLTYVIRSVSYWFARVVHERDRWDESLEKAASGGYWAIVVVVQLSRFLVWLTRRVLWLLMWTGQLLSASLLRQMEYDADRYEARLVGVETFQATQHEIRNLSLAQQATFTELRGLWREGKLADDLPGLIRFHRGQLPDSVLQALRQQAEGSKTGIFDTHPADADRIASAQREGGTAVFDLEASLPAALLLRDFEQTARLVSRDFYAANLGAAMGPEQLRPLSEVLEGRASREAEKAVAARLLRGALQPDRVLPVVDRSSEVETEGQPPVASIEAELDARQGDHVATLARWREIVARHRRAAQAEALIAAKASFSPKALGLESADASGVFDERVDCVAALRDLEVPLREYELLASERLRAAFREVVDAAGKAGPASSSLRLAPSPAWPLPGESWCSIRPSCTRSWDSFRHAKRREQVSRLRSVRRSRTSRAPWSRSTAPPSTSSIPWHRRRVGSPRTWCPVIRPPTMSESSSV